MNEGSFVRNDGRASHRFSETVVVFEPSPYARYDGSDLAGRGGRKVQTGGRPMKERSDVPSFAGNGVRSGTMAGRPVVFLKRWSFSGRRDTLCTKGRIWRGEVGVRFKRGVGP
jgi:hypothetical protein